MVFDELFSVNVNDRTEKKKTGGTALTYLSWPFAWAEVKKRYPNASYSIWKDEKGVPYAYDENTGFMVYTAVNIEGVTHEMWLPVMDGANKAMKSHPYEYQTKNGSKTVEAATMFDINKTIMRCLTKNLAMFGLGLYIYAGEDLPEAETEPKTKMKEAEIRMELSKICVENKINGDALAKKYGKESLAELSTEDASNLLEYLKNKLKGAKHE